MTTFITLHSLADMAMGTRLILVLLLMVLFFAAVTVIRYLSYRSIWENGSGTSKTRISADHAEWLASIENQRR